MSVLFCAISMPQIDFCQLMIEYYTAPCPVPCFVAELMLLGFVIPLNLSYKSQVEYLTGDQNLKKLKFTQFKKPCWGFHLQNG